MVEAPAAPLRLLLDAEALAANWRLMDALSGSAQAGAAVKADAYGLGALRATRVLAAAGCRDFFVAHWQEAAALLDVVPAEQIAVLHGPAGAQDIAFARATGVRPVLNTMAQVRGWAAAGGGACHVMVDTGMSRLGLPAEALGDAGVQALAVDVLLSHLASAEEETPQNAAQLALWQQARGLVPHRRASLANSAGILLGADYHGDLTRPGLALYGGLARPELAGRIRQVARPQAALLQLRDVPAGAKVGYNATFTAPVPMRLGVVSLGYADGYLRCWSGRGALLSGGRVLPVVGRVSMDLTIVDLSAAPDLAEGDWLDVAYDLAEASARVGLSPYELLTVLGRRFSRAA
ncbi:MAG TPA: alanine racemase [Novosphingobium sp.]|nr:alanine racemase [Novosphingobium sp.]